MVEVEMRIDDQIDMCRVPVDRFETGADLLAGLEADPEQPGEARAQPPDRVMLAIGVQPGIEQRPASRMLDQKNRHRERDVTLATLHQAGKFAGHCATSERVELDRHPRHSFDSRMALGLGSPVRTSSATVTADCVGTNRN